MKQFFAGLINQTLMQFEGLSCRKLNKPLRLGATCASLLIITSIYVINTNNQPQIPPTLSQNDRHPNDLQYDMKKVVMKLPKCGCSKEIMGRPNLSKYGPENSTCEKETFIRGPGQKVVAFTFYEPITEEKTYEDKAKREYFRGIEENVKLVKELYGLDWTVRVYYQVQETSAVMKQLCDLACQEPNLDICNASSNSRLGNATILYPLLWRFLPAIDVNVDVMLSRDLDSRVTQREVSSVNEFLESDKDIHVMRDHAAHTAYMMGGTWGAKVNEQRLSLMNSFKKLFKDGLAYIPREKGGGYDQIALVRYVWSWGKKVALSHDSYNCHKFSRTSPFPVRRIPGIGNFIGAVVSLNSSIGFDEGGICPEKCRPKAHQDWIYC